MPIYTAIVSDFFEGGEAMQMMGWISASNHFGGMAAQMISGMAFAIMTGAPFLVGIYFHRIQGVLKLFSIVMAIVSSMMYLGQFLSPIIIDSIGKQWMPVSQGTESPFIVACCMNIVGIILAVILISIINNKYHIKTKKI